VPSTAYPSSVSWRKEHQSHRMIAQAYGCEPDNTAGALLRWKSEVHAYSRCNFVEWTRRTAGWSHDHGVIRDQQAGSCAGGKQARRFPNFCIAHKQEFSCRGSWRPLRDVTEGAELCMGASTSLAVVLADAVQAPRMSIEDNSYDSVTQQYPFCAGPSYTQHSVTPRGKTLSAGGQRPPGSGFPPLWRRTSHAKPLTGRVSLKGPNSAVAVSSWKDYPLRRARTRKPLRLRQ